ncbi:MAG: response regulator [Rubrivivax sp.]|nr:MAG: response regulator [Rubrivivax sp.]
MPGQPLALPSADELFEDAACGLVLTDLDGRILRVNRIFCHWLGHGCEQLIGQRRVQDLLTMGGRVFHQTHWAPLMQMQGSVAEVKLEVVHRDGHKVPMLFNAVRRRHGDVMFDEIAAMVVHDRQKYEQELLLARKAAEAAQAQLTHADRRKDEFLATLAHELRNPLAPMQNVVRLLKRQALEDAQLVWAREVLDRQLAHLTHLVDDLLEISRITQGKVDLRCQRMDLRDALHVAVEAAQPFIDSAGHALALSLPEVPVMLHADPTRVTQMVLNLLNNAAKYTPQGGRIALTAEVRGGEAVVAVRDSGIGISADQLPGVFEMFSQVASALERADGGLGIGLALVKGLAALHGGRIEARSEGPGLGSEFTLSLPLVVEAEDSVGGQEVMDMAMPEPIPTAPGVLRIAVVDDNEDSADSLAMLLEMQGHELRVANDGLAAVMLLAEFRPHAVLLDIGLPGIDGFEVARRVRAQPWGQAMLLVALTGWGQQQDKDATAQAGFDHHLVKPVNPDDLAPMLERLARQA